MTRIAIIDHDEHQVYIEDLTDEMLAPYNGDEQKYIDDNYDLENYSWDYITDILYLPNDSDGDILEVDIEKGIK